MKRSLSIALLLFSAIGCFGQSAPFYADSIVVTNLTLMGLGLNFGVANPISTGGGISPIGLFLNDGTNCVGSSSGITLDLGGVINCGDINASIVSGDGSGLSNLRAPLRQTYTAYGESNVLSYVKFNVLGPGYNPAIYFQYDGLNPAMWYVSSNLTASAFFGDGSGLTGVSGTVGLTITQHITDFILGAITNVYSNGLLVATGAFVVPVGPLIGAGGDTMLGAFGESLEGAG